MFNIQVDIQVALTCFVISLNMFERAFVFSKAIHSVNDFHSVYFRVSPQAFFDNPAAPKALSQPPSKCWPLPSSCGRVSLVLLQNHALTEDKDNNEEKVLP